MRVSDRACVAASLALQRLAAIARSMPTLQTVGSVSVTTDQLHQLDIAPASARTLTDDEGRDRPDRLQ